MLSSQVHQNRSKKQNKTTIPAYQNQSKSYASSKPQSKQSANEWTSKSAGKITEKNVNTVRQNQNDQKKLQKDEQAIRKWIIESDKYIREKIKQQNGKQSDERHNTRPERTRTKPDWYEPEVKNKRKSL